jgi:hypothetical protein
VNQGLKLLLVLPSIAVGFSQLFMGAAIHMALATLFTFLINGAKAPFCIAIPFTSQLKLTAIYSSSFASRYFADKYGCFSTLDSHIYLILTINLVQITISGNQIQPVPQGPWMSQTRQSKSYY